MGKFILILIILVEISKFNYLILFNVHWEPESSGKPHFFFTFSSINLACDFLHFSFLRETPSVLLSGGSSDKPKSLSTSVLSRSSRLNSSIRDPAFKIGIPAALTFKDGNTFAFTYYFKGWTSWAWKPSRLPTFDTFQKFKFGLPYTVISTIKTMEFKVI